MKYLIVGLGNVGEAYEDTRHNIGFLVTEHLAQEKEAVFETVKLGQMARIRHRGRQLLLLKPSTFMNRSGKAVRYWMQKENISLDRVLVVVDDIHLVFGRIRIRSKGSDGGHNGLRDIIQMIGGQFIRMRLGIGKDFYPGEQVDYVLGSWTGEEKAKLPEFMSRSGKAVLSFAATGVESAMDQFNS